jgi:glucosyl-dolichyl phosphate glucuronosyltransferase
MAQNDPLMNAAPSISVVICANDDARFAMLTAAVRSVVDQVPAPHEVIVVIDHNEPLRARAAEAFREVRVTANAEAPGLSGGRNTGVRMARGEIVAFMDDDATARPGWLQGLADGYRGPEVLGVGGTILASWQEGQPAWFPDEFLWVVGCTYRGYPTERAVVRNLIGCNMSFRRSVFDAVGGFHQGMGRGTGLPLGCEETELCVRAALALPGGGFLHEPESRVDHVVPATRGRLSYFLVRSYSEGISKAYVVRLVGSRRGMETERRYLSHTLAIGALRHAAAIFRGSLAGPARSAMIVAGLAAFGVGYLRGLARFRHDLVRPTPLADRPE